MLILLLSTLSATSTKSDSLNQAFTKFLEASATWREAVRKILATNVDPEQGLRFEIALKFLASFQENWPAIEQAITNLIQECNNYREQMYSLTRDQADFSADFQRLFSIETDNQTDNLTQSTPPLSLRANQTEEIELQAVMVQPPRP